MATKTYTGSATQQTDRWTGTVAAVWAAGDVANVTINGRILAVTIGTLTTTAQVATTIKEAFQSTTFTDTTATCLPVGGGTSIPEMSDITASISVGSTSVVNFTADGVGEHTLSMTETTAGTGTFTSAHSISGTGPNYYNATANWDTGTIPVAADDVVIDRPVSILYGTLDQSAVTVTSLTIGEKFTSAAYIGLPARNTLGYEEYRQARLKIGSTTTSIYGTSGRIRLDNAAIQTALTQYGAATLDWIGTHASNAIKIFAGTAYLAAYRGEVCTILTLTQTGGTVECGSGATLGTIIKDAGTLTINSSVTTSLTSLTGTTTINGGTQTLTVMGAGTLAVNNATILTTLRMASGTATIASTCGAWTTIDKSGGTLTIGVGGTTLTSDSGITRLNAGAVTTANISSGTLYLAGTGTITACNAKNCTINVDNGTTAGITITTLTCVGEVLIIDTAGRLTVTNAPTAYNGTITYTPAGA